LSLESKHVAVQNAVH